MVDRGDAGPASDVDVGVLLAARGAGAASHHRLVGELASRLEQITFPRPLDLILLEDQGLTFRHEVLLEGRLLYEGDRERRIDFESDTVARALDFRPTWEIATSGRIAGLRRWLRRELRA